MKTIEIRAPMGGIGKKTMRAAAEAEATKGRSQSLRAVAQPHEIGDLGLTEPRPEIFNV